MTTVTITDLRKRIHDLADRVYHHGEHVCVKRNGRAAFAMVTPEELRLLEAIEDQIDIEAAQEALNRGKFIPWKQAKRKLGL
jgi:PHD/YefM family antitoxin component YafN of YafNO toxin-antitoxin module